MFRRLAILSIITASIVGTAAWAQGVGRNGQIRDRIAGRRDSFADRRDAFTGRALERMQQRLNLTDVQMNGIRALQENQRKEMESVRQEMQQKRQAVRQRLQEANPNPNDVGNAVLSLRESRQRIREINQRFMAGVKGLLTPDQLQQLQKRAR